MQFSKNEDFGVYPKARVRHLVGLQTCVPDCILAVHLIQEEDHRKLLEMGCAAVFEPPSLYHPGTMLALTVEVACASQLRKLCLEGSFCIACQNQCCSNIRHTSQYNL